MDKRKNDIEKYLKGEFTAAEMHALEKEALDDPFLAEALEGGLQIDGIGFSNDVASLNEKIIGRKTTTWTWPLRIAATVLLLAVSMFLIWIALKQEPEQQPLALKPSSIPNTLPKPDSSQADRQEKKSTAQSPPPLIAQSKKEITPPSKQRSKKSPVAPAENKKIEQAPELTDAIAETKADSQAGKHIVESPLDKKQKVVTIDPDKKHEIIPPSANEIKIAEGYIAAIDARPTIVTGRVLSAEDGTPLPDVSVALKGTSVMTKTDAYGRYSIIANSQQKTLVYSSEGLESTEVKFDGIDSTYLPVKIEMTDAAQEEAAVETSGMRDFGPTNVYTIPAHPETGNRIFKQYLEKNHKYPREAKEIQVEGTVIIEFKVDATGALSEFRIVRGIGNGCDEEVIRLILQGAKWVPTTKDGTPVNDKARVKFKFELE